MSAPRHCLSCGARLRAGRQDGFRRWRCPRCGWTFYDNPAPATVAIVVGPRGILLCRRAVAPFAGYWDLAGGFLEADETPERGLRRELREELGARIARARFRGFVRDRYGPGGFPVLGIVYEVRVAGRITPGSDVSEVRWVKRDAIPWRKSASPRSAERCETTCGAATRRSRCGDPARAAARAPSCA